MTSLSSNTSGSSAPPAAGTAIQSVQFFHPNGQAKVRPTLDALINSASRSFRAAVCYFTKAGCVLLRSHKSQLNLAGSYFVACIAPPTDLGSLLELHNLAPGHIYLHMGGKTPKEKGKKGERALMHSKVLLAEDDSTARLWVGSHNLTAPAIEGTNYEAGVHVVADSSCQAIQDAARHLENCKVNAEPFDPSQMDRYREIQQGWKDASDWIIERGVLIIHAEASVLPGNVPFIAHIRLEPIDFDRLFRMDGPVRLFLHPPGTLKLGVPVDYTKAILYTGKITAVVRTELHPENSGAPGQFADADFDICVPNLRTPPVFAVAGQTQIDARTQVVVRLDGRGVPGGEVYSVVAESPIQHELDAAAPVEMHEIDDDMRRFFTPESLDGDMLLYRPVIGVKQRIVLSGYEETLRSGLPERFVDDSGADASGHIEYEPMHPDNPIDSFFFLSKHVVRPRRTE